MAATDVIIIGGGMIGLSTALHLARVGKQVTLVEKNFPGKHASGVNAGGVRSLKRDPIELPLIHGAMEMWHHMEALVGSDCGFFKTGYLVAAETDKDMAELEERAAFTRGLGYDNELVIDARDLKKWAPAIADHCLGGLMSTSDGHASPAETCRAYHQAACAAGAVVHANCRVLDLEITSAGFKVTTDTQGVLEAEQVLNCAGAWAGEIGKMVGEELPITPVGPSVIVTAPMPRMFHRFVTANKRKLWFNQAKNRSILICGGYLAEVDMAAEATHLRFDALQQCVQTALDLFDVVGDIPIVRAWAGLDGDTPDILPIMDRSRIHPGLMHACGFSKHGFALSPMVGKVMAQALSGRTPEISLDAYRLDRPGLTGTAPVSH